MSRRKPYGKFEDTAGPPDDQPWCWLSRDVLKSPAWKSRTLQCMRLIDFLMMEHLANGGRENGKLAAPWDQLEAHGIGRRFIARAIEEAEALKLIAVDRGAMIASNKAAMSRYRLTFYASPHRDEDGRIVYYVPPGDEWRRVTPDAVAKFFAERPRWPEPKIKTRVHHLSPKVVTG